MGENVRAGGSDLANAGVLQSGQITTSRTKKPTNMVLITAGRFRRKRRHACWFGLRCSRTSAGAIGIAVADTAALLITNPRVDYGINEIHDEIENEQQHGIKQHQANRHRVVPAEQAVDEKNANPRDLENSLDHK